MTDDFLIDIIDRYSSITKNKRTYKLTKAGNVVEFLGNEDNRNTAYTAKQISDYSGINKNTTRKELGKLLKRGAIKKIPPQNKDELTKYFIAGIAQTWYRHLYGLETYCGGGKGKEAREQWYARTYKKDKANIRQELFNAIRDEIGDSCGIDDFFKVIYGYEIKQVADSDVNHTYEYPNIEVTQEI